MSILTVLSLPLATEPAPLDSGSPLADTIESVARSAEAANLVDYSDINQAIAVVLIFLITGATVAFCYWQTAQTQIAKARLRSAENIAIARDRMEFENRFGCDDPTDINADDDDSEIDLAAPPKPRRQPQLSPNRRAVLQDAFEQTAPLQPYPNLACDLAAIDSGDCG